MQGFDAGAERAFRRGFEIGAAVEPILAAGRGDAFLASDGWMMKTRDHSLAPHCEHTLIITRDAPILLTAA